MANISVSDLQPAGLGLFANSESFIGSMRDLSDNELNLTRGGSGKKSDKSYKSKSKSGGSYGGSCGCGYGCIGGGGGDCPPPPCY